MTAVVSGPQPGTADYLVGTTQPGLSAEIVVGTAPGGELGGTWAAPTVDATHSGSSHAATAAAAQAAAEATAAADATAKVAAEAVLARNADNLASGTVADARIASTIARDSEVAAEAVLARNADNLTSGTVPDARIAATIARVSQIPGVDSDDPMIAQSFSYQSGITAATDLTGVLIGPFTVGDRPWMVQLTCPQIKGTAVGDRFDLYIKDDADVVIEGVTGPIINTGANYAHYVHVVAIIDTPGVYNLKATLGCLGSGTVSNNNVGGATFIRSKLIAHQLHG